MDKYERYYGILTFLAILAATLFIAYSLLFPTIEKRTECYNTLNSKLQELSKKKADKEVVVNKIKKIKDLLTGLQKKVYSPTEVDQGNDTLFFTLYNDLLEMMHNNSIKIKSIDYEYNPESDAFVKVGKDQYFVCEINAELVSNYINLGKLIQDIYQYPYYIKIKKLDVKPYERDKKILISNMSLILYAHTAPDKEDTVLP